MSIEASSENPRVDTSNITVAAFNSIKQKEKQTKTNLRILGRDDKTYYNSPNFKVKVRAWTRVDDQSHTYFHSLSIDVNVDDFMGTAELKCPYDSDLMEYWTPISQDVVIYGSNRGPEKILFIGRVRGVKQDGYELVVEFQNYGWKFKQLVTQSYANDNVLGKDGYTIMRLMFEALKIDSWVISDAAKKRLKEVGINKDGNLTVNGKEVKKIPDLLTRLRESDPSKYVNKNTLNNKLREKYLHNINNINYTLKYEKPTPVMKKISSQGDYSAGSNVYKNAYGSASAAASAAAGAAGKAKNQKGVNRCTPLKVSKVCPAIVSTTMQNCMNFIYLRQRGCRGDIKDCRKRIMNYASGRYSKAYLNQVSPCLHTLSKGYVKDLNVSKDIVNNADAVARASSSSVGKAINSALDPVGKSINHISKGVQTYIDQGYKKIANGIIKFFGG